MTPTAHRYLHTVSASIVARDVDVTPQTVSHWRGGRPPGAHYLQRLEEAAHAWAEGDPVRGIVREYLAARDALEEAQAELLSARLAGDPGEALQAVYTARRDAEREALRALRGAMVSP